MAITTLDGLIAAPRQKCNLKKTTSRNTVANGYFSMFDVAGNPGAGTLSAGNTANGIVPVDTGSGYPTINAFGGGATGYISKVSFACTVACRINIYDRLFVAGAYAFNANTALASQPSFSSRVPNTDYSGLEIWVEQVTAATGSQAVTVTYTNELGTGSRSTGAVGIGAAPTLGRCWQLPLQAGDSGVQQINNVQGTVASAGTFNVMVLRPLASCRIVAANFADIQDFMRVGLPTIYADSALYFLIAADSTVTGIPEMEIDIVNG